jgi:hypothetical protein
MSFRHRGHDVGSPCYQCFWTRRTCWTCGSTPHSVHIPARQVGYYCGDCCPACVRSDFRFALEVPTECVARGCSARTWTSEIGSDEIIFKADRSLDVGTALELLIDWPATPPEEVRVRLRVDGIVLRCRKTSTTVQCVRHRFQVLPGGPKPFTD